MSGGQKIKDHSFWAGGMSSKSVLAEGVKHKSESSAEGAGELSQYEDTTEAIRTQQKMGTAKANAHKHKAHYKN